MLTGTMLFYREAVGLGCFLKMFMIRVRLKVTAVCQESFAGAQPACLWLIKTYTLTHSSSGEHEMEVF